MQRLSARAVALGPGLETPNRVIAAVCWALPLFHRAAAVVSCRTFAMFPLSLLFRAYRAVVSLAPAADVAAVTLTAAFVTFAAVGTFAVAVVVAVSVGEVRVGHVAAVAVVDAVHRA